MSLPKCLWPYLPVFINLAQKNCKVKSPKPYFHFSLPKPHFTKTFNMNLKKLLKVKILFHLDIWALKTRVGLIEPKAFAKTFYKP